MEIKAQGIFITMRTSEKWGEYFSHTNEDLMKIFEEMGYETSISKGDMYVTIEGAKLRVRTNVTDLQFYVQFNKIYRNDFAHVSKFLKVFKNRISFELGVNTEQYTVSAAYRLKSSETDRGTDQVLTAKYNPRMFFAFDIAHMVDMLVKQFITNITTAFTIKG